MDVSKNRGTPKWIVYNGHPYFLMGDWGGNYIIFGNIQIGFLRNAHLHAKTAMNKGHVKQMAAEAIQRSGGRRERHSDRTGNWKKMS